MDLTVALKGDVLSCNAMTPDPPGGMKQALIEGSEISVEWKIRVSIERKYWLDNSVADVLVNRHVVPDLVSRSWMLEDLTSGITRRVFSLEEAIRFLTILSDFPIVDRSLLSSGQAYIVAVALSEQEGKRPDNFWASWFSNKSGVAATEFIMP